MRLLKKWDKINYNKKTDKLEPYRSFYLTDAELAKVQALPESPDGFIHSSQESEDLLREILESRGMESLLYPKFEYQDWSGYVRVYPTGLFEML